MKELGASVDKGAIHRPGMFLSVGLILTLPPPAPAVPITYGHLEERLG